MPDPTPHIEGAILDSEPEEHMESARARDLHESLEALEAVWDQFAIGSDEFGRADGGDPTLIRVRQILLRHGRIDSQGKTTG